MGFVLSVVADSWRRIKKMRNARQVLAQDVFVTNESARSVSSEFGHNGCRLLDISLATREERRRLLEASVTVSAPEYALDQEWVDANLDGSHR